MEKKRGRKTNRPNKEKFESIYYNDQISAKEIAEMFKVTESTIYNWAFQFKHEGEENRKFH